MQPSASHQIMQISRPIKLQFLSEQTYACVSTRALVRIVRNDFYYETHLEAAQTRTYHAYAFAHTPNKQRTLSL